MNQPVCKHCGRPLVTDPSSRYAMGTHAEGRQRGLNRCDTADSGLPYGYDAAPVGEPCSFACLGSTDVSGPSSAAVTPLTEGPHS